MKKNKKASDDNTPIRQDEIKTEPATQEKREKKKKPIFKRVWFWIIIVIIVLIIVAAALSGDDDSSTATEGSIYNDAVAVDMYNGSGTEVIGQYSFIYIESSEVEFSDIEDWYVNFVLENSGDYNWFAIIYTDTEQTGDEGITTYDGVYAIEGAVCTDITIEEDNSGKQPSYSMTGTGSSYYWDSDAEALINIEDIEVDEDESDQEAVSPGDYDDALKFLADSIEGVESNTSTMVDTIASAGKKAANYWSGKLQEEAVSYLAETYPNYFVDNETMEYTMFYGYYLEYAFEDNGSDNTYANLGMDAYQVVKYIYRGTDTEDSDKTQANLEQIGEALEELGY